MTTLESFLAYASAFEETFKDDDWSRLGPFFADDAVYEIRGPAPDRLSGKDAIFRGMKKSLDGFDRRTDSRTIAPQGDPEVSDDTFAINWCVTYTYGDAPPLDLIGRSEAELRDGKIVHLADVFTDEMGAEIAAWCAKHAPDFDLSYS